MSNINQLSSDTTPQLSDQIAIWNQNSGQPRKASLSSVLALLQSALTLPSGILSAASLYGLRRTQAENLALTAIPVVVAPYDANGNSIVKLGGQALTLNVVTGLMQATRVIQALDFWVALDGSLPNPRVLTLQVQTGPVGGALYTSEFQAVKVGTGAADCYNFAGVLQNPNNVNSVINTGDIIQLVASADQATTLAINRVTFVAQPLDGV